jgi:hypothetical protein
MNKNGFLLTIVLTAGFIAVWGIVSVWSLEVWDYTTQGGRFHEGLYFRADGSVVVNHGRLEVGESYFTDLEGNAVASPFKDVNDRIAMVPIQPRPFPWSDSHRSWDSRISGMPDSQMPQGIWYRVSDGEPNGKTYIVGYDSQRKTKIGYLGTAGFRERPLPEAEHFAIIPIGMNAACSPGTPLSIPNSNGRLGGQALQGFVSPWDLFLVGQDGKLYHVDLQARTVRVMYQDPDLQALALASVPLSEKVGVQARLVARTTDAILVFGEKDQVRKRYPIPESLRNKTVFFGETSHGEAVMYWQDFGNAFSTTHEVMICWVSPDGRFREATTTLQEAGGFRLTSVKCGAMLPSPLPLATLSAIIWPADLVQNGRAATMPEALAQTTRNFAPAMLLAQVVAILCAIACYRRQRRYAATRRECLLWTLYVVLFGLPGWIGYRFGRTWPVLQRCAECETIVPQDREMCAQCETAFAEPALLGTEVFA